MKQNAPEDTPESIYAPPTAEPRPKITLKTLRIRITARLIVIGFGIVAGVLLAFVIGRVLG